MCFKMILNFNFAGVLLFATAKDASEKKATLEFFRDGKSRYFFFQHDPDEQPEVEMELQQIIHTAVEYCTKEGISLHTVS